MTIVVLPPWPARDDEGLFGQSKPDRVALAFGKGEAAPPLDPCEGLERIDWRPGKRSTRDTNQPLGNDLLSAIEAREKHAVHVADPVGDHGAFRSLEIEGGPDQVRWRVEQAHGERDQLLRREPAVPLVHRLGEGERDAGPETDHRALLEPEPHCDCVGGLEADAANVPGKAIGILRHHLHGVGTVGLVYPHGARRSDPIRVQEHHDLADDLLLRPGVGNSLGSHRADAGHFPQTVRLRLDRVEHLFAERPDELLRVRRADASDHSRAEVFLDPLDRRRRRGFQEPRPELLPVRAVVHPFARRGDPLARRNRCRLADDGHEITMPARLGPEHTEPVLRIVERDPLVQARQGFLRGSHRIGIHVQAIYGACTFLRNGGRPRTN